jgi:hypothetical protein
VVSLLLGQQYIMMHIPPRLDLVVLAYPRPLAKSAKSRSWLWWAVEAMSGQYFHQLQVILTYLFVMITTFVFLKTRFQLNNACTSRSSCAVLMCRQSIHLSIPSVIVIIPDDIADTGLRNSRHFIVFCILCAVVRWFGRGISKGFAIG